MILLPESANRNIIFENFKAVSLGTMPMNQNIGSVCVPTTVSTMDNWDRPLTYVITPKSGPLRRMTTLRDAKRALNGELPKGYWKRPHWSRAALLLVITVETGDSVASTATSFAAIRLVFTSDPRYRFSSMTRSCSNAVRSRSSSACSALIFAFSAAAFGWRPAGDRGCISAECRPKRPFWKRAL